MPGLGLSTAFPEELAIGPGACRGACPPASSPASARWESPQGHLRPAHALPPGVVHQELEAQGVHVEALGPLLVAYRYRDRLDPHATDHLLSPSVGFEMAHCQNLCAV